MTTYKLHLKNLLIDNEEELSEINVGFEINDICFIEDKNFFIFACKDDDGLGMILKDGTVIYPWLKISNKRVNLDRPSAITYNNRTGILWVIEDNGKNYKRVEVGSKTLLKGIDESSISKLKPLFSKQNKEGVVSCCSDGETIYSSHSLMNMCFQSESLKAKVFFGNGKSGFASANKAEGCRISNPQGICFAKNKIYLADSGNNCIRQIEGDNDKIISGFPCEKGDLDGNGTKSRLNFPKGIKSNKKFLVFIDGNKVKQVKLENYDTQTIDIRDNEVAHIETIGEHTLAILERIQK